MSATLDRRLARLEAPRLAAARARFAATWEARAGTPSTPRVAAILGEPPSLAAIERWETALAPAERDRYDRFRVAVFALLDDLPPAALAASLARFAPVLGLPPATPAHAIVDALTDVLAGGRACL